MAITISLFILFRYVFVADYKGSSQLEDVQPDKPGLAKYIYKTE